MNPYLVLGVAPSADDATIRQAYLAAVRESPPDTHPQRFQAVSAAYDQVKDEPSRLRYLLFNRDCPGDSPLEVLLEFGRFRPPAPLPLDQMQAYLRSCWKCESP
jgi:curved DNA-binding protein CbpA